ncbi:SP_0198 family lipoprotein [Streptococcus pneumoniae]
MNMKKQTIATLLSLAGMVVLAACSNQANQPAQTNQASASSSEMTSTSSSMAISSSMVNSESSAASSSSQATAQPSSIDGTYKGMDEGDEITLVMTGETGTWTKVERDGEQEIKQVRLDAANQQIIIGDDVERYLVNGNQLTIEELDQDFDKDTIVLTKQ